MTKVIIIIRLRGRKIQGPKLSDTIPNNYY